MRGLLIILTILFASCSSLAHNGQDDFVKTCPPTTCGSGSGAIPIRFPFRLQSAPASCGVKGLELTCSGNDTLLSLPSLPPFKVTAIYYAGLSHLTIHIGPGSGSLSSSCPLRNFSSFNDFLHTPIYVAYTTSTSLVNCSEKFIPHSNSDRIAGPISCLSRSGYFVYAVDSYDRLGGIPPSCMVFRTGVEIPDALDGVGVYNFGDTVEYFEKRRELNLWWNLSTSNNNEQRCEDCEYQGKFCGFDWERNQTFCYKHSHHHGLQVKLIIGASVSGFFILVAVASIVFYIPRQSEKEKEMRMKVERFLTTYKNDKPTRYTYSDIKKITKRFRFVLGQGGFGSVYKGELPNRIPVAVKILERSEGEVKEFINEVAIMGRIHHVNVVRLLGFCSEGTRHALIYEFMPNESLEKFIFSKNRRTDQPFGVERVQDIAIGIARGIEYLHQGCDQRILHFDIKPHNILLDHNFNPKIADFGLAKLCPRDQSIVTITAARGTMGYIAPEIYSRNFGTISYKSDVYSFGILLLEMVSGRRNVDPAIENQSEVYFPEWVYNRLVHGEDLGLTSAKGTEVDIVKKLVIVALWCIQWNPADRPTMARVVQLLMGHLESLQIPPKPFVASSELDDGISLNEV